MISGRGYGYLGNAGGGVVEYYPQRKKEGLLEINEHFIHSKKYRFITSSFALGIGFATWWPVFQTYELNLIK